MTIEQSGVRRAPAWADVALGLGVCVAAAVLAWQVMQIPASPLYAAVGPAVFPWAAVLMLGVLGLALTVEGLRGGWAHDEEAGTFDLRGFLWFAAGAILNIALIEHIGFVLASTILFVFTARAFESRKPIRDTLIGFTLAFAAYVGFDQILGYRIGSGIVESYVQAAAEWLRRRP
jgi:putative tricarboxylic transport membrane protein